MTRFVLFELRKRALDRLFSELSELAPRGFGAGLHIRHSTPLIYRSTYPSTWVEVYNSQSYYLRDPVVFWGFSVEATLRWSEINLPDPFGIMSKAALHGLKYGAACAHGPVSSRSIIGIARSDREFDAAELSAFEDLTRALHSATAPRSNLTRAQREALLCVASGDRYAEAAAKIGITESAFKARLQLARQRLGARTTTEAVRLAREHRWL